MQPDRIRVPQGDLHDETIAGFDRGCLDHGLGQSELVPVSHSRFCSHTSLNHVR